MLSILNTPQLPNSLLHESFDNLKADEYLKSDFIYRYRAYGVGEYENNEVTWNETGKFLQTKELNSYVGGLEREFTPLQK